MHMRWLKFLLVALLILGIDCATKVYVHVHVPFFGLATPHYPYGGLAVFQGVFGGIDFSINHVLNRGAAWGVFSSYQHVLIVLRIALIAFLILYLFRFNKEKARGFPLLLVIAGAIGNVIDFFVYGHVIDFLHFKFWGYSYPLFNVADSTIFCGIALLILHSLWTRKKKQNEQLNAD